MRRENSCIPGEKSFFPHSVYLQEESVRVEMAATISTWSIRVVECHHIKLQTLLAKAFPGLFQKGIRVGPVKKGAVAISNSPQQGLD